MVGDDGMKKIVIIVSILILFTIIGGLIPLTEAKTIDSCYRGYVEGWIKFEDDAEWQDIPEIIHLDHGETFEIRLNTTIKVDIYELGFIIRGIQGMADVIEGPSELNKWIYDELGYIPKGTIYNYEWKINWLKENASGDFWLTACFRKEGERPTSDFLDYTYNGVITTKICTINSTGIVRIEPAEEDEIGTAEENNSVENINSNEEKNDTPGFEILVFFISIISAILIYKKRILK